MDRFLVKSFGDNVDGVKVGLQQMLALLAPNESATIIVPAIGQVKSTMLSDVLGEKLTKKLIKDRVLNLDDGKKIHLCAQSALKNFRNDTVYLNLWGSATSIKNIEEMTYPNAIIQTNWTPADSADWESSNNVTIIYDDGKG